MRLVRLWTALLVGAGVMAGGAVTAIDVLPPSPAEVLATGSSAAPTPGEDPDHTDWG